MKGRPSERDPFAGYTPVKVPVPVVDVGVLPSVGGPRRARKYKFGGDGKSSGMLHNVMALVILLVSVVFVAALSAFFFGVIYDRPVQQAVPELGEYADGVNPLVEAGRSVRRHVMDVDGRLRSGGSMGDSRRTK